MSRNERIAKRLCERLVRQGHCPEYGTDVWAKAITQALDRKDRRHNAELPERRAIVVPGWRRGNDELVW